MIVVLKKFGFDSNFINWIKILLTNQESCFVNSGNTTSYFKLEKRHGPISAYLFTTALEIIFARTKSNPNIKGLSIFNHNYLYTAYADDRMFFVNYQKSISEVAGIGSLKGVKITVCDIKCIDITTETIKILGVYFSCNQKL